MVNLSSSLAKTLAHTGITVNTVSPGTILTPAVTQTFTAWAQQLGWGKDWNEIERRFIQEKIPFAADHFGQPEDLGRMVALLSSPLSAYTTGQLSRRWRAVPLGELNPELRKSIAAGRG